MSPSPEAPRDVRRPTTRLVLMGMVLGVGMAACLIATPSRRANAGPPEPAAPPIAPAPTSAATAESLKNEALAVARRLLADFPNSPDAIGLMGMVHDRNGNSAEAVRCWEECVRRDPGRADVYDAMGIVALKKGEHERAAALWRKALEINPRMPGAHHRLARALMGLGKLGEAIAELEKDVKITPGASRSYFLLGQAHQQLRQYQQAKEFYRRALEARPGETDAYYGLATVCARLGQNEEAGKHREEFAKRRAASWKARTALRRRSDDVGEMRHKLAQTCTAAGRIHAQHGALRKAEALWRRAAVADPKNTGCREALASLYQSRGREKEALQVCEQLRGIQPNNPVHHLNIGSLNARLKRVDAAEKALKRVIELAPSQSTGYRALAGLYLNTHRMHPDAKKLAATAVRLEPTAANYYVLSVACDRTGDLSGARAAIRRALELAPSHAGYRRLHKRLQERK